MNLQIGIPGYTYADLYNPERLRDLTELFFQTLRTNDPDVARRFDEYRHCQGQGMEPESISDVLTGAAPYLSAFICELFQIQDKHQHLRRIVLDDSVIFVFKREFVTRRALKAYPRGVDGVDQQAVTQAVEQLNTTVFADVLAKTGDPELGMGTIVTDLISLEKSVTKAGTGISGEVPEEITGLINQLSQARSSLPALDALLPAVSSPIEAPAWVSGLLKLYEQWVAIHHHHPTSATRGWVSLKTPETIDFSHLVKTQVPDSTVAGTLSGPEQTLRQRDGFGLTDNRYNHRQIQDEVEYCIFCHGRGKDSCSKGLHDKDGSVRKNPLGIRLDGCPLDEKISEAHLLKSKGDGLAGLALIMIDNPMCPGTGHRICNDCMKGCIYQKQEPVNIPQIETGLLTEVLQFPFGFEIYSLLTRWNPLNIKRPYALPYNGKKVLVVGLGPAGYTLAHYLVNEGFGVVGIDGLKIEPLPESLTGTATQPPQPVADWRELYEELDDRVLLGFGGVSEYGITVRWDKNFLKVIYIALARRSTFSMYGGVRFGGTITIDDAWDMGFDHIAIATGAGKPTIVPMKNNLLRGMRQASDFLMALQLTGAYKPKALANLQLRLPAIVVGGGLTGIDTATEAMAYYPVQVERVLDRSEVLTEQLGQEKFWSTFGDEDRLIMQEFIEHGKAIRQERRTAAQENRAPDFTALIRGWGGVSLVYRKSMVDAPAYRLNHEEIIKALEEGIYFVENLSPVQAVPDSFGAVSALVFERQHEDQNGKWRSTGEQVTMPARSVMIAAGTSPNTIIERETPGAFQYDEWKQYFAPHTITTGEVMQNS